MIKPLHPGIAVRLSDGNDYVIPSLPYPIRAAIAQKHGETIALLEDGKPAPHEQEFVQDTVHAALVRNYPELTLEQTNDLVQGIHDGALRLVLSALCRCNSFPHSNQRSN